ncbi:MAG: miaB 1, partial [Sporomusa sp.]|nr:miaB 1 [Sporomusa sp.]
MEAKNHEQNQEIKLFYTETYGCQMNLNDSERLAGQL